MNRVALAAAAAALVVAAGAGGFVVGRSSLPEPKAPPPAAAKASPTPAVPSPPAPAPSSPAQSPSSAPTPAAAPPAPPRVPDFAFQRVLIDSSRASIEACLAFNDRLQDDGSVRYQDFIALKPDLRAAIRVAGNQLCLGGLSFGATYNVELKAGLPARDGRKLALPRDVEVALGERPATIAFSGGGYVLPRQSAAGVPITSVNVSKVNLRLFRVGERGLAQLRSGAYRYDDAAPIFADRKMRMYEIDEMSGSRGRPLWSGSMEVRNVPNQPSVTAIPLREMVPDWKPGAYLLLAWNAARGPLPDEDSEDRYDFEAAVQWVMDTDVALTAFTGDDGLTAFARSLHTAKPLAGVEVTLMARNNEELARVVSDADGKVSFPAGLMRGKGALEPVALHAVDPGKSDFSQLSLQRAAFDFSDRGVDGRPTPGAVDAFLYSDRGIYRPGEVVHVTALVRDRAARALAPAPITLVVRRPDGVEVRKETLPLQPAGVVSLDFELAKSSRRGRWSVDAYLDPKGEPVGKLEFSVEDFVPQKLKVALSSPQTLLRAAERISVAVAADFLYGAPAAGLEAEAQATVSVDPAPFPALRAFRFGLVEEQFRPTPIEMGAAELDAQGKATISGALEVKTVPTHPLRAQVEVRVLEPGGRATSDSLSIPLRPQPLYIGLRPLFDGSASESRPVPFEIVAVDAAGARVAKPKAEWRVIREQYSWQWYRVDNNWRWERQTIEKEVLRGTIDVEADKPASWSQPLPWGHYRLVVSDPTSQAATSVRFWVGWRDGDVAETPDTLPVSADKPSYRPGETAKVRIVGSFAGEAMVVLANDKIHAVRTIETKPDAPTEIDVPVSADWGAGVYALVTAYRPLAVDAGRAPVRAVGLVWLGADPAARRLDVQIDSPEKMVPRQRIELPVRVADAAGKEVYVTLSAVDEGILQLTRFATPDPVAHYFGKRRLGVFMRDDYGRLLDPRADETGKLRSGGDAGAGAGLEVVPIKVVALHSGVVKLGADGSAKIAFDVPDFIGQLRLMAVAFDAERVGSTDKRMFVRDPVATDLVLPRFLAPGDSSQFTLSLHNVEGAAGRYTATLATQGPVAATSRDPVQVELAAGARQQRTIAVRATEAGVAKVTLKVEGPGGFSVSRDWEIEVRPAAAPTTTTNASWLAPGGSLTLNRDLLSGFVRGTGSVSVSVSPIRGLDIPGLLAALDRYPYGCLEQTTSRAFPLLFFNELALLGNQKQDEKIEERLKGAIRRVLDMQMADGAFGMWNWNSYPAYDWLQVYVIDFLISAKKKDHDVPEGQLARALSWLNRNADALDAHARPYAFQVLAREGVGDPGRLRYFQDTQADKLRDALSHVQLAAALQFVGERGRAMREVGVATAAVGRGVVADYYGSSLRDAAAAVASAADAGLADAVQAFTQRLETLASNDRYWWNTQEQAWTLIAAHRLLQNAGKYAIVADGRNVEADRKPLALHPDAAAIARGYTLRNEGQVQLWTSVNARGVPAQPLPPESAGVWIERGHFTLDGRPANLAAVRQNDRLVVVIEGGMNRNTPHRFHEIALLDLLPAGFEIEAALTAQTAPYAWLQPREDEKAPRRRRAPGADANEPGLTVLRTAEKRDDRFFAALDVGQRTRGGFMWRSWSDEDEPKRWFRAAYVVRAITPGTYALPAAQIEDMYRPQVRARTAAGSVTILPR